MKLFKAISLIFLLPFTLQTAVFADSKISKTYEEQLYNDPFSPVYGDSQATIPIVYFSDYRCPYCKKMHKTLKALANENKDIKLIIKEFPIIGKESYLASSLALASKYQDKYYDYHSALMNARGALTEEVMYDLAKTVGIDIEKLKVDKDKLEVKQALKRNYQLAINIKILGTPACVIGDEVITGYKTLDELKDIVAKKQ